MSTASHVTHYDLMPIPPIEAHTRYFEAGVVRIGVEYRLLDAAIASASETGAASGSDSAETATLDDRGVCLHVFVERGGSHHEALRFDCFEEDPHYHYVSWRDETNDMIHLDPIADGDPLAWALERLRTRLVPMLERAGEPEAAARVDPRLVDAVLPQVSDAAYRARFEHDDEAVRRAALGDR